LIDLAQALGEKATWAGAGQATVVVASIAGQVGGLEVERLGVAMDVMLTPVSGLLAGIPGVAGTTLLSDGRVLIVLELEEVLQ
jgi:two-component system chemotaxis sensor kinase CheA